MKLFIVESASKIPKLQDILGKDYVFGASFGHVAGLPKRDLGVDVNNNFSPTYVLSERGEKTIASLKSKMKSCDMVYLATDLDREGEAIAWHLKMWLGLKPEQYKRVVYGEITPSAIKKAIDSARDIDMDLVAAQECRTVLDRLVGYPVSNALQKRTIDKVSAGRVQTVALLILARRELDIIHFKPTLHFGLKAQFNTAEQNWHAIWNFRKFAADANISLDSDNSYENDEDDKGAAESKVVWTNTTLINTICNDLNANKGFDIVNVTSKSNSRNAPPPLTTSLMQQAANTLLGYSSEKTMQVAQKLFEDGIITYHRTDSKNLSDEAISEIRSWITNFAAEKGISGLLPPSPRKFDNGENAQEAHEAIRPSYITDLGENIKDPEQKALYKLIWSRAIASQMSAAQYNSTVVKMRSHATTNGVHHEFEARGNVLVYPGWKHLVAEDGDDVTKDDSLPKLNQGSTVDATTIAVENKKTSQPKRFSEASLVKLLDKKGVGRPSTYASIIKKLLDRKFTKIDGKVFVTTKLGLDVIKSLENKFAFVDIDYTSRMESELDMVAKGAVNYKNILADLWRSLEHDLAEYAKDQTVFKSITQQHPCYKCGSPMSSFEDGQGVKYWYCINRDNCKTVVPDINGRPIPVRENKVCVCGNQLTIRRIKGKDIIFTCAHCQAGYAYDKGTGSADLSFNLFPTKSDFKCPICTENGRDDFLVLRRRQSDQQHYWACLNREQCNHICPDVDGKPNLEYRKPVIDTRFQCPNCNGKKNAGFLQRRERNDKTGHFWACSNRDCNKLYPEKADQHAPDTHVIKCQKCNKGEVHSFIKKGTDTKSWVCNSCKTFFDDQDGNPRFKALETDILCPMCEHDGVHGYMVLKTIKNEPHHICQTCNQKIPLEDGQQSKLILGYIKTARLILAVEPAGRKCDKCKDGKFVVLRTSRGAMMGCSNYPKCDGKKAIT